MHIHSINDAVSLSDAFSAIYSIRYSYKVAKLLLRLFRSLNFRELLLLRDFFAVDIFNFSYTSMSLRQLLVELEQRRGWEALGYGSMTACIVAEFKNSKPVLVRELKIGRMEKHYLRVPIGTYLESQLRPLSQLEPTRYQDAVEKAHQIAGGDRITSAHVNQAVKEIRSKEVFLSKLFTPPTLPYYVGDIVLVNCDRAVSEPYAKYNGCWAVVSEVLPHGCSVQLMGQQWNIHWNDLKAIDLVDETLKLIAVRVVSLLASKDLDEMEREILERYHKRQWFTSWQLNMLQAVEAWQLGR